MKSYTKLSRVGFIHSSYFFRISNHALDGQVIEQEILNYEGGTRFIGKLRYLVFIWEKLKNG